MPLSLSVSLTELAALAANIPLIVASNNLRNPQRRARWGASLTWADSDDGDANNATLATAPEYLAYDGKAADLTYPATVDTDTFSFFMDLDSTLGDVDAFALIGHNLADLSMDVTVTLVVADDEAFTTNAETLATWTLTSPMSDRRLVSLDFGGATLRYQAVRYARLTFVGSSNFTATEKPRFGELVLGRRRQFLHNRRKADDDRNESSSVGVHSPDGGNDTVHVFHRGRRDASPKFTIRTHATAALDEVALWDAIWSDTEQGTRPFLYLAQPNVDVTDAPLVYLPSPKLVKPWTGPFSAEVGMSFLEKSPFVALETAP